MSAKVPAFLTIEQVEVIHRISLERHGGQDGLRVRSAFESAVMHPRNIWLYGRADIFELAAAYAFHLAQSQAFIDGNKRTGMGAALVFLEGNGTPVPVATEELHGAMIAIAERRMNRADLAHLFRKLCAESR